MRAFPLLDLSPGTEAFLLGLAPPPPPPERDRAAEAFLDLLEAQPGLRGGDTPWRPQEEALARLAQGGARPRGRSLGEWALELRWPVLLRACPLPGDLGAIQQAWPRLSPKERALLLEGMGLRWPEGELARDPVPQLALEALKEGVLEALWALRAAPRDSLRAREVVQGAGQALERGGRWRAAGDLVLERREGGGLWEGLQTWLQHRFLLPPNPQPPDAEAVFLALLLGRASPKGVGHPVLDLFTGESRLYPALVHWSTAALGPSPVDLSPGGFPGEAWALDLEVFRALSLLDALHPELGLAAQGLMPPLVAAGLAFAFRAPHEPQWAQGTWRRLGERGRLALLPFLRGLPPETLHRLLHPRELREWVRRATFPLALLGLLLLDRAWPEAGVERLGQLLADRDPWREGMPYSHTLSSLAPELPPYLAAALADHPRLHRLLREGRGDEVGLAAGLGSGLLLRHPFLEPSLLQGLGQALEEWALRRGGFGRPGVALELAPLVSAFPPSPRLLAEAAGRLRSPFPTPRQEALAFLVRALEAWGPGPLGQLGPAAREAEAALAELARDGDPLLSFQARGALLALDLAEPEGFLQGYPRALRAWLEAKGASSPREEASWALAWLSWRHAYHPLLGLAASLDGRGLLPSLQGDPLALALLVLGGRASGWAMPEGMGLLRGMDLAPFSPLLWPGRVHLERLGLPPEALLAALCGKAGAGWPNRDTVSLGGVP